MLLHDLKHAWPMQQRRQTLQNCIRRQCCAALVRQLSVNGVRCFAKSRKNEKRKKKCESKRKSESEEIFFIKKRNHKQTTTQEPWHRCDTFRTSLRRRTDSRSATFVATDCRTLRRQSACDSARICWSAATD